jgi:ABC-2 type transport system ATP-binding protein
MIAVRTEELHKVFGEFTALNGLNLSVEEGTIFGFLGPNGAGKTTTIRILTGLAHASSGKAWVMGNEVTATGMRLRQIGFRLKSRHFTPG